MLKTIHTGKEYTCSNGLHISMSDAQCSTRKRACSNNIKDNKNSLIVALVLLVLGVIVVGLVIKVIVR